MRKNLTNRLRHTQPDYLLVIVRKPDDWVPSSLNDEPPAGAVRAVFQVASYEEAHDDLLRCNRLATRRGLKEWAVVHSPGTNL